jgi:pimeloyl-ACP methyl ester carboxylesterase
MKYVFLPGMDGTGLLFEPILRLWTESPPPMVVSYPSDRVLGYKQLQSYVVSLLPTTEPYVLIAESYSGPIAARIAATHPPMMRGLILSATFIRKPRGWIGDWSRLFIGSYLFRQTWTHAIARILLKWQGFNEGQIQLVVGALEHVRPRVLAARLKEALDVEAFEDLRECNVPILCLYAERDLVLADRCRELIAEANPRVKLVGLDTPHFLLQAKPAEALHEIQLFTQALRI